MHATGWIVLAGAVTGALVGGVLVADRRRGQRLEQEMALDTEVDDSFPASDPPSHTPTLGTLTDA